MDELALEFVGSAAGGLEPDTLKNAAAGVLQESRTEPRSSPRQGPSDVAASRGDRAWIAWVAAGAVLGIAGVALTIALLVARGEEWLPLVATNTGTTVRAAEEPLPVPSASDVWLARARTLYAKGHLRDALTALDAIRPGDSLSAQADELRATVQRQLLAAARASETADAAPARQDRPRQ